MEHEKRFHFVRFGDRGGSSATPDRRWVIKGSKPEVPYAGSPLRRNVIGAVCPGSGELSCLVFTHCDTKIFQAFLDNLAAVPA